MADEKKIVDSSLNSKNEVIEKKVEVMDFENIQESGNFSVEKEKAKEIAGAEDENAYKDLSKAAQASSDDASDDGVKKDAQEISEKMDAESQIQHLVDLATAKGVVYAVKVAKHLEDNYVLDMMHDKMISDEFHKVLVEKGMVSEE